MTTTKARTKALAINNPDSLRYVFARRLAYAIEKRGYTPTQFAREVGMAHSTINRYISGEKLPNLATLRIIVAALDVSCDWLCVLSAYDRNRMDESIEALIHGGEVSP